MSVAQDRLLAFPRTEYGAGMTLRDWFAGQALAGMLANGMSWEGGDWNERDVAGQAYVFAKAMLAEREKDREAQP